MQIQLLLWLARETACIQPVFSAVSNFGKVGLGNGCWLAAGHEGDGRTPRSWFSPPLPSWVMVYQVPGGSETTQKPRLPSDAWKNKPCMEKTGMYLFTVAWFYSILFRREGTK